MNISNINIRNRLTLGFSIILIIILCMAVVGYTRLNTVTSHTQNLIEHVFKQELLVKDWHAQSQLNGLRYVAHLRSNNAADDNYYRAEEIKQDQSINALQNQIQAKLVENKERALFENVRNNRETYFKIRQDAIVQKAQGVDIQSLINTNLIPAVNNYVASIENFLNYYEERTVEAQQNISTTANFAKNILIISTILGFVLATFIGWVISKSIVNPLKNTLEEIQLIAQGNLAFKPYTNKNKDELGMLQRSMTTMHNNLKNMVEEIRMGAENISSASAQISAGNLDLSSRTEEQAASLEETAATMEEISSTVSQNTLNTKETHTIAVNSSEKAKNGGEVMEQVISTMNDIKTSSSKITSITALIDSIAFQTNILALNAAVEAARAGEHGKGFAVVASEVRALSHKSAEAAKNIKSLIEDSIKDIQNGEKLVQQSGTIINDIVSSTYNMSQLLEDISNSSQEQHTGIEQINQAITQIDSVTQQNAALVEEVSAAAQSLQEQSRQLVDVVHQFKT